MAFGYQVWAFDGSTVDSSKLEIVVVPIKLALERAISLSQQDGTLLVPIQFHFYDEAYWLLHGGR